MSQASTSKRKNLLGKPSNPKKLRMHEDDQEGRPIIKQKRDHTFHTSVVKPKKGRLEQHSETESSGSSDESSDGEETFGMKRPTLLRQLQTILNKYPDNSQILRELVQNAEDAGATCMKIWYDHRPIDPGGKSKIGQYFKSPGICVYNDAMFSEEDWDGIITIYNSIKENEPLKVGKFGLGFKSVFHMTDYPVIFSGEKLLIIDPQKSETKEDECLSIKLNKLMPKYRPHKTMACIFNKFGLNDSVLKDGHYPGTLFWFPLRQKPSKLCPTVYPETKVSSLFSSFVKEGGYNILFLNNLELIEIHYEKAYIPVYTIQIKGVQQKKYAQARKKFRDDITKSDGKVPSNSITTTSEAVIKTKHSEDHYVIARSLMGTKSLSNDMQRLLQDKELGYSPFTGVAYCTKSSNLGKPSSHIFCFLPLPIAKKSHTGLPVHINGLFDLEDNRRHLKLPVSNDESEKSDKALLWNVGMIKEILPEAYYLLVRFLKEKCKQNNNHEKLVEDYYSSIPDPEKVELHWHPLITNVYTRLLDEASFYTKQGHGKWVKKSEAVFSIYEYHLEEDIKSTIESFLLQKDDNVVKLPPHMIKVFKYLDNPLIPITPTQIRQKLKTSRVWKRYPEKSKLDLLTFILQDGHYKKLCGIELLPLNNKEFVSFSNNPFASNVYILKDVSSKLFPGMEEHFISKTEVKIDIWRCLDQIAKKGMFQLRVLANDGLPELLKRTLDMNCKIENGAHISSQPSGLGIKWISDVWKHIMSSRYVNLDIFHTVPLIPLRLKTTPKNKKKRSYHSAVRIEESKIEFLPLKGNYMLSTCDNEQLSKQLEKILSLMGIRVLSIQMITFSHVAVIEKYIKTPTANNILACFEKGALSRQRQLIGTAINDKCNDQELSALFEFLNSHLSDIPKDAKKLLRMLNIVQQSDNLNDNEMVSINENNLALGDFEFPKDLLYPETFVLARYSSLAKCLGGSEINEQDCITNTISIMCSDNTRYTVADKRKLMVYLNKRGSLSESVLIRAREVAFMPSTDGMDYRVKDLFNPSSKGLQSLFFGEEGVFPDENYLKRNYFSKSFLEKLGIKTKNDISSANILRLAKTIHGNRLPLDKLHIKANALLAFIKDFSEKINYEILGKIQDYKWIQCCNHRPHGYPSKLVWYSENVKELYSPREIKLLKFKNLIGSVTPLVDECKSTPNISQYYEWSKQPPQNIVIEHYENVIRAYTEDENSNYLSLSKDIWKRFHHLDSVKQLHLKTVQKLKSIESIPIKHGGFKSVCQVVSGYGRHVDFNLEPYIFELSSDVTDYLHTFLKLGMESNVGFEHLKCILQRMSQIYKKRDNTVLQVGRDRKLVVNILSCIVNLDVAESELKELLVPIASKTDKQINFRVVKECTYTVEKCSNVFPTNTTKDPISYVHPDINHLAPQLGVPSVKKRFMFNQNTIILPWGQSESLTARIKNLLSSYTDGFAVFKELIQNADDAGATKVSFLYDERHNTDCRDGLFDDGMADCQGQALWFFNNALFKDSDFKNLIKLGAKSKLSEKGKIGKFGLGFCAVYNLTDMPSILSRDKLIILDPHTHHLGEFTVDGSPGILVPLTNEYIRAFPNQFKPYNDMFGCNLFEKTFKGYKKGSLFRFPLRTRQQASESEIYSVEYTKREVVELLLKLYESAADLLLFTQNVTEISVHYLHSRSTKPNVDQTLLFQIRKANHDLEDNADYDYLMQVTRAMAAGDSPKINFPLQVIDISIKVHKQAESVSKSFKTSVHSCTWVLAWSTGSHSHETAKALEKDGAVPIGAVAVPVNWVIGQPASFRKIAKLPRGFSSTGRIFCFLPLPIDTDLLFHVNGCFMVEADRKSIVRMSRDDKYTMAGQWNITMFEDIIKDACINLLTSLASKVCNSTQMEYWELWPKVRKALNQDTDPLVRSLYKSILNTEHQVFYRTCFGTENNKTVVASMSKSIFLCPTFRNSCENGKSAYEYLLETYQDNLYQDKFVLMDMPTEIYENFRKADEKNLSKLRIISKKDFFSKHFFPGCSSIYWQKHDICDKRDNLLMEAFDDEELHYLIENSQCIPVKGLSILRKPADLVLKTGFVRKMFCVKDGRFPMSKFCKYEKILLNMQMMNERISSSLLVDRAKSVQHMTSGNALARSKAIIEYLKKNVDSHSAITHKLKSIPFLPVMNKPSNWPLPWKGDQESKHQPLMSPEILFASSDKDLIGSVGFVLDPLKKVIKERVLNRIGIQKVTVEKGLEQLVVIGKANSKSASGLEEICEQLYKKLDMFFKDGSAYLDSSSCLEDLWDKRIIKVGKTMTEPSKVSLKLIGNCKPYLFEMPGDLHQYNTLWGYVGIPKYFDSSIFKNILVKFGQRKGTTKVSCEKTSGIINILRNLCSALRREKSSLTRQERNGIFVPDRHCIMRCIDNVCYDERDFPFKDDNVYIIHGEVTEEIKEDLGILSKRHLFLQRNSHEMPFGQREKLVTRLSGLLLDYPKDYSILNELLQNADDSGATEIHFILDLRHMENQFFDKNYKSLPSGPALCVFNNACFSETDLRGIQDLGEGSKVSDPTKTGKFGVGFNAVYHFTDVPAFLTRGPTTPDGGSFCVFDPHCWYVPTATTDCPGRRMKIDYLESKYKKIYAGFLQDILPAEIGTWFRFSLRKRQSAISRNIMHEDDIKELLENMKEQMKRSLLFLSYTRKISISYIEKDADVLSKTFSVSLLMSETAERDSGEFALHVKNESDLLRSNKKNLNELSFKEVNYTTNITDNYGKCDTWLLSQTFGFKDTSDIPSSLVNAFEYGRLGFLPRGGVAFKVILGRNYSENIENSWHTDSCQAFCCLPLPIKTGFPCHINGHFSVHSNRSQIFEGVDRGDLRYIWNQHLLQYVIAHSYASCLDHARKILPKIIQTSYRKRLDIFFSFFPYYNKLESSLWKKLSRAVFSSIFRRKLAIFPICPEYTDSRDTGTSSKKIKIKWTSLTSKNHNLSACFDDLDLNGKVTDATSESQNDRTESQPMTETYFDTSVIRHVLVELGMKLVCSPLWIYDSMCESYQPHDGESVEIMHEESCNAVKKVSPEFVMTFLKSWNCRETDSCSIDQINIPLESTVFKTIQRLECVLKYCLKESTAEDFEFIGLPLLADNAGNLVALSSGENLILSKFCNLLPASRKRFVHSALVQHLQKFRKLFEFLSLQKFVKLLSYTINPSVFKQPGPIDWNEIQVHLPHEQWIEEIWKYLNTKTTIIPELFDWCLFPALWYNNQIKLVSFNLAHTVINHGSFDSSFANDEIMLDILSKLSLPSPSRLKKIPPLLTELVASKNQPKQLAKCLVYHKTYIANHILSSKECDMILDFFTGNIDSAQWREMRSLRLYTTVDQNIVDVDGVDRVLVVNTDNNSMAIQGLDEMTRRLNTILVKYNRNHENIYDTLNFIVCLSRPDEHPLTEFYISFILQYFNNLPKDAHIYHLEFIRDKLLKAESKRLEDKLKTFRFIPQTGTNTLKMAVEFFSPHNSVFRHLCSKSELPPYPFYEVKWEDFMNVAGIQQNVRMEQFVLFARRIEREGLNDNSISQCKELLHHFLIRNDLTNGTNFLQQIRDIKFIVPFTVEKKYAMIYPQLTPNKLIAFSGCIRETQANLAWTTDNILPSYAVPKILQCRHELQINNIPTTDNLVIHLNNICSSMQRGKLERKSKFIKHLMKSIYEYLANVQDENPDGIMDMLVDIPIVHILDQDVFLKAKNVVLKEPKTKEILPYLMIGPEQYGEYFELFRRLGATDEVNLDQYFRVLENIKAVTGDLGLHYDELQSTENAVRGILTLLQKLAPEGEVVITEHVCYLLGENNILHPSNELVFVDDKNLKERLKNYTHIKFLASMDQFTGEDFDVNICFEMLPSKYQPQKLSIVVKEELQTVENQENWEVASTLGRFLSGDTFIHCITRLIHSDTKAEKHKNEHVIDVILTSLRSIRVTALRSVRTILVFDKSRIKTSIAEKKLYYSKAENVMYVSVNSFDTAKWVAKYLHHIASVMDGICLGKVEMKYIQTIISNYSSTLDEMTVVLDEMGVLPVEFKHVDNSWVPAPGTPVPQDCLQFLVQTLVHFSEGDYAVYEVFDNLFDIEDDSEEGKAVVLVYVKIVRCLSEDDEQFPMYRIDVGDGQTIDVRSLLLYKIVRPGSSNKESEYAKTTAQLELYTGAETVYQEKDKDQIFQEVEEALIDAWNISPDDCKRVYKRLLLLWHPDKNNHSKLCNEVTKHIIDFFKRLRSGKINTTGIPSYRERREPRGKQKWNRYRSKWRTRGTPESTSQDRTQDFNADEFAERVRRQNAYTNRSYYEDEYRPNPQPKVAEVWLRQAQNDLTAARSLMKVATSESFNWVCVASHQAAEKALKAVQIFKDANKAGRHHSLITSVSECDPILLQAVQDLESRVGDYTRMRYPKPYYFPRAASDLYKREDATETIRLAEIIVENAKRMIK